MGTKYVPEGCGLNDDLHISWELTGAREGLVNLNGVVHVAICAERGGHLVGLVLLDIPGRGPSGPEDTSGCSVGLCGRAERSRRIVAGEAPRVASDEYMRRIHRRLTSPRWQTQRVARCIPYSLLLCIWVSADTGLLKTDHDSGAIV